MSFFCWLQAFFANIILFQDAISVTFRCSVINRTLSFCEGSLLVHVFLKEIPSNTTLLESFAEMTLRITLELIFFSILAPALEPFFLLLLSHSIIFLFRFLLCLSIPCDGTNYLCSLLFVTFIVVTLAPVRIVPPTLVRVIILVATLLFRSGGFKLGSGFFTLLFHFSL